MMYYTTVSGWMLSYFWKYITGHFDDMEMKDIPAVFDELTGNPVEMLIFMAIIVILGFLVLSFGVQKGLERVTKGIMIGLLGLILLLAVNSLLLKGGADGLKFYLMPNLERTKAVGWDKVINGAMSQAFFTLSLGIGAMEIFGSYMSKEHTLTGESIRIISLDTVVALMAGLIIFLACSAFGVKADQGPSLIFITLPNVFSCMDGGRVWGSLFFLFMVFACFSTILAVFENLVCSLTDNLGWKRAKSIAVNFIIVLLTGIPCVLGFNVWSDVRFFGGKDILSFEDFIMSNIILPVGSIVFMLFCTWKFGWGAEKYLEEVNTGKGIRMSKRLIPYFKYVLPVLTVLAIYQLVVDICKFPKFSAPVL